MDYRPKEYQLCGQVEDNEMEIKKIYELPMLSSNLHQNPVINLNGINISIELDGGDVNNVHKKTKLLFKNVLCHMHTSERFTKNMFDAYDAVVEIIDSRWIGELKKMNERDFNYWKPKHFAVYLEGVGMYQFIAKEFEELENV